MQRACDDAGRSLSNGAVGRVEGMETTPEAPDGTNGRGVSQLVAIGASAGGIEVLLRLVGTLPADFSAPIVVAQHLDPRRPSHLGESLASRSPLPCAR